MILPLPAQPGCPAVLGWLLLAVVIAVALLLRVRSAVTAAAAVWTVAFLCVGLFLVLPQIVVDVCCVGGFTHPAPREQTGRRLPVIEQHLGPVPPVARRRRLLVVGNA